MFSRRSFLSLFGMAGCAAVVPVTRSDALCFDVRTTAAPTLSAPPRFAYGGLVTSNDIRAQVNAIGEEAARLFEGIRDLADKFGEIDASKLSYEPGGMVTRGQYNAKG